MKKKLLFVLPEFKFGGTVYSTLNMISLLPQEQYDIYVLPMTYQGPMLVEYKKMGIKLIPENILLSAIYGDIKKEHNLFKKIVWYIIKIIRRLALLFGKDFEMIIVRLAALKYNCYKFDVVSSCQEGSPTKLASVIKAKQNIAWFRCEATKYFPYLSTKSHLEYYKDFEKIVCVSRCTGDDFKKCLPQFADKVVAIHNAQNLDDIYKKANMPIDDRRFLTDCFTMISLGRMNPSKRMAETPFIAKQLKDAGYNFKWYILGDGNDNGEKDNLIANITNLEIDDRVIYLGGKVNPYPYINKSDILVSLSLVEACPRAINEALILKKPCICTDFASASEFVFNGKNGYVTPIENIVTILSKIINNKDEYDSLKTFCEKYAFDNTPILASYNKLFNQER